MDDDEEEREFSRSIVFGFFEQAEQPSPRWIMRCEWICTRIDLPRSRSLTQIFSFPNSKEKDLGTPLLLGPFLKGSSATLGLTKVKDSCEKIQHYGQNKDEHGTADELDNDLCLKKIRETLIAVKEEYAEVEKVLPKVLRRQGIEQSGSWRTMDVLAHGFFRWHRAISAVGFLWATLKLVYEPTSFSYCTLVSRARASWIAFHPGAWHRVFSDACTFLGWEYDTGCL